MADAASRPPRQIATFEIVPGSDINEIRAAHPEWTEEECRQHQSTVALEAFKKALAHD